MIYPLRRISHTGYKFLDKGKYGEWHPGIDLNAGAGNDDLGEPIIAPINGVISHRGDNAGAWGNHFHLKCETLLGTRWFHFGHCQEIMVVAGQQVSEGEVIAKVGNSGGDWTAHLHFECKKKTTGVDFYPKSSTTKTWILDHYEDPLVFIDTINNLNQQSNDVSGLKDIVGTQKLQINEMNKEIEGLEEQVKNHNLFFDKMWEKLSPITIGDKNESSVLAEIEKLIFDEDQLTRVNRESNDFKEQEKGFLVKLSGLLNITDITKENVVFEIQRLQQDLKKADGKIKNLTNKITNLEKIKGLVDASASLLFSHFWQKLFRKGGG